MKTENVFDAVRGSVTARQAAESVGIHVNRSGMAVCGETRRHVYDPL